MINKPRQLHLCKWDNKNMNFKRMLNEIICLNCSAKFLIVRKYILSISAYHHHYHRWVKKASCPFLCPDYIISLLKTFHWLPTAVKINFNLINTRSSHNHLSSLFLFYSKPTIRLQFFNVTLLLLVQAFPYEVCFARNIPPSCSSFLQYLNIASLENPSLTHRIILINQLNNVLKIS